MKVTVGRRLPPMEGMGSWNGDARKAMDAGPDYFLWWYSAKSILLVGVAAVLAYTIGKEVGRKNK